jgi:hypothetical protein
MKEFLKRRDEPFRRIKPETLCSVIEEEEEEAERDNEEVEREFQPDDIAAQLEMLDFERNNVLKRVGI